MQEKLIDILSDKFKRVSTLYTIVDKKSSRVPFRPNKIQQKILTCPAKRKAILKARQFGVSTGCIIDLFDDTIWNRNRTNVILAHEDDAIKKIFRIVRRAYEFLPDNLKPQVDRGGGSKYEMYFPKLNSIIYCDLESRGDTINNLHISEAAFADKERIDATLQAVPIDGRITYETTPNGIGNWFHDFWVDDNFVEKMFFPWFVHDEYRIVSSERLQLSDEEINFCKAAKKNFGINITEGQIRYRRFKQAELRQSQGLSFTQEYPEDDSTCFLASGKPAFDLPLIKKMYDRKIQPIRKKEGLKIYREMDKKRTYVIGADTAEGVDGDYSVAVVIEMETLQEVAIMRGHWKPHEFAHRVAELARQYSHKRPALVAVERNNHGHAVLLELTEHIKYPNVFCAEDGKPGWKTNVATRPVLLDTLVKTVEDGSAKFVSDDFLGECLTLINNDGKLEAAKGKHDDCVIAGAIAVIVAIENRESMAVYSDLNNRIKL